MNGKLIYFHFVRTILILDSGLFLFSFGKTYESLSPYIQKHGSMLNYDSIHGCHRQQLGTVPHEVQSLHQSPYLLPDPYFTINRFLREIKISTYAQRIIRGHVVTISDPLSTLSVLEPNQPKGCSYSTVQTVQETAEKGGCVVAVNAGYFDTKNGTCLGNVVSDGYRAHSSNGIQNAHFGLTNDYKAFFGYLSEEEYEKGNFKQLVGGVVWILRNGTGFVNTSKTMECEKTEETGAMDRFINILSARTVVGQDKNGKIVIVQVDGKSDVDGINLYEMEIFLKDLGLVNAINLDGGGSSTLVSHNITINFPYDECPGDSFVCDRKVSTILCVHPPYCDPPNCNNHGQCVMGKCNCDINWMLPNCFVPFCGATNCSGRGTCLPEGCECQPGYYGEDCNQSCEDGWYGSMCKHRCSCMNHNSCDSISGACICKNGFTGKNCEEPCKLGYFGSGCQYKCQCSSCYCDPVSGNCNNLQNTTLYEVAKCLAKNMTDGPRLKDYNTEKQKWFLTMAIMGTITSICIMALLLFLCCSCSCRCQNEQLFCFKKNKGKYHKMPLKLPSGLLSESSSDSENFPLKSLQKK